MQQLNWNKINIFLFLENWQFYHQLGPPLSSKSILCLKDYCHNLTKYEIKGDSKIPICQLFSELVKVWECNLGLYLKISTFHLFLELENIEKPRQSNIQKSQNLFVNWEKLGRKIPVSNLWENLVPNWSLTVEKKIAN